MIFTRGETTPIYMYVSCMFLCINLCNGKVVQHYNFIRGLLLGGGNGKWIGKGERRGQRNQRLQLTSL